MRALVRLGQTATLLLILPQKLTCKKTLSRQSYVAMLIVLLALLVFPIFAWASGSSGHIDTSNIFSRTPKLLEVEEPKEVNFKKAKEHTAAKEENLKETSVQEKAEKEEKGEVEEKEEEPSWKIPGWQSIFTALAVVFYALMLTVLPKIMAKEVEHH